MADEIIGEAILDTASTQVGNEGPGDKKPNLEHLSDFDHKMIDKDMKYRGPLSYRGLRLIGWIAMAVMFVSMMLNATLKIKGMLGGENADPSATISTLATVLSYFSALPLPLFLIANFAVILQSRNNYKKLITSYLKILAIVYVAFMVVYYHYVVILLMRVDECSFAEARTLSVDIFTALGKQNGLVVNVFVDLFCCVLIMFFLDYTPKNHFQGKKIILFRLLALLPFLYEVVSAVLMGLLGMNSIFSDFRFSLPPEILPLIGKKPIGMIFGFVLICIYIKIREKLYLKKGGTPEGYTEYVKTNRNSFRFSLFMAITFGIIAIVDFLIVLIPALVVAETNPDPDFAYTLIDVMKNFTLGKSFCLILVVPFILLFSYSKQHENQKLDKMLPIIGVGLVVFSIIETLFFGLLF